MLSFAFKHRALWCSSGSTLWPLLFNAVVNDISDSICCSTEDFQTFRCFINAEDRKLLQSDIDCVRKRCLDSGRILSLAINTFIYFNLRTNSIAVRYSSCPLRLLSESRLYFHNHVDQAAAKPSKCYVSFATSRLLFLLLTTLLSRTALLSVLNSKFLCRLEFFKAEIFF